MLGYGAAENMGNYGLAASVMASAPNLADWQMIAGGLLGFFGIFLEGLAYFAFYRLMADAAPKYAHLYRAGIFGYIWLAPVGCHMNVGVLNMAYVDPEKLIVLTGFFHMTASTALLSIDTTDYQIEGMARRSCVR